MAQTADRSAQVLSGAAVAATPHLLHDVVVRQGATFRGNQQREHIEFLAGECHQFGGDPHLAFLRIYLDRTQAGRHDAGAQPCADPL